jgi:hypothetical protein
MASEQFKSGYPQGYEAGYSDGKKRVLKALKIMCRKYKDQVFASIEMADGYEAGFRRAEAAMRRRERDYQDRVDQAHYEAQEAEWAKYEAERKMADMKRKERR